MRTSETRSAIVSPITYDVAKQFLGLDHDDFKQEVIDTIEEVVDELELTTNAVISQRSCTITFYDPADSFRVPGVVVSITSVTDGNGAVVYSLARAGTSVDITPSRAVTLPMTVTYQGGTVRPVVRRLIKEMLAFRMRFKGDESADYPASIQRVLQRLTNIRL
jgi:hypothetical protein